MPVINRAELEQLADELMQKEFARIPRMRELHAGEWIDREYYTRHLVETVLRIRLNNEVDTYALFKVGSSDDVLAGNLAKYLAEEFGHEHMFIRDLKAFGLSVDELNATSVFPSTSKLMGYLRLAVDREGPAPTTVWNWFVEWYSDRYNPVITAKAAAEFGSTNVRGSQAHLDFDSSHDHGDLMFRVVSRSVTRWSSAAAAANHLAIFVNLIGDYFGELYDATAGRDARDGVATGRDAGSSVASGRGAAAPASVAGI